LFIFELKFIRNKSSRTQLIINSMTENKDQQT